MYADSGNRVGRALTVLAAGMLAASVAVAGSPGSVAQHMARQVTSSIIDEVVARREALQDDPRALYELVDRLVLPHFDFERMSRRVLGKRWKSATSEQRARFVQAFRTLLVRTYATVLNEYRGQALTWLEPMPRKKESEFVVPLMIDVGSSEPIRVAYAMHDDGTDWKVFDVAVDGVSLVTNYRSAFRSEIARHGVEGLIARLEAKNSDTD